MSNAELQKVEAVSERNPFEDLGYLKEEWEGRQTDWLLQWLVKFSNNVGVTIGITLSIGGTLVSGELVSHKIYFDQFSEDFSSAFKKYEGVDTEELKVGIQNFNREPAEDQPQPALQYLHLKNARVYTSSATPVIGKGQLWRGKISSVDGFTLGSITQS